MTTSTGVTREATPEATATWPQALAWRMERQLLDPTGAAPAADVVRRLGAVLSMDDSLADLAVCTRSSTARPGDLAAAVADGSVIKAFAYRGAVHYLAPEDAGIYLALRSAGRQWELKSWVDHYRLGPQDWPDFRAAVREALGDASLTVTELGDALTRHPAYAHLRTVFDEGPWTLLKPLSWQGDLSLGPLRDGRITFQRLDRNERWAGIPDLEDAGPRAVAAYFRSYGPATLDRVHYWLGNGLSAGRRRLDRWIAGLGDGLVPVDIEGTTAYAMRQDVESLTAATPSEVVRLLPGHDQWVMGAGTKDVHVIPPPLREAVTRKANPVLAGGVVRGTWARKHDELTVTWADRAPAAEGIEQEVARLGDLLGVQLRVRVEGHGRGSS
ncbi:DNA glycosylase AlkZ-like family protein [Terrabacter carboxydivorans]|uniref:Winged helix DNA-binding domain-containing protein n=1 Tax=Terrabacter carboxydivorans TaxID=619730 RepID=A0ABN3LP12_9MICO